ncbi:MAG: site-specific DNA-methyltransferase [Actinomycetota bacterium]|nr:site-specific DNA-methyltransferase [Actinomycetota bacterium]MDZ4180929.1 site-specific DNA-methyltransferase [Coriobacteriia bacterium]
MSKQVTGLRDSLHSLVGGGQSALVHADADDVLPLLVESGEGMFRAAIVDPPYNRRTKFHHYSDSTLRTDWAAERERQAKLLRRLLSVDGSLWMHIDDAEMHTVRHVLDCVFGPTNFVATIVWQKSVSRDNRVDIATTHEYVLVYAKERGAFRMSSHRLPVTEAQLSRYKNPDGDPRGAWTSGDLTAKAGPGRRAEQFYDLILPSGRVVRPSNGTAWRYTRERLEELAADGRIDFGNGDKIPRLKRFLAETDAGLVPDTWWSGDAVGTADTAKRHLKAMFPTLTPFETPKPEPLTERIMEIATDPGDFVIDCYAGSGTTAAVAHKMGRRFVAIEREDRTFHEFTVPRLTLVDTDSDSGGIPSRPISRVGCGFQVLGPSES